MVCISVICLPRERTSLEMHRSLVASSSKVCCGCCAWATRAGDETAPRVLFEVRHRGWSGCLSQYSLLPSQSTCLPAHALPALAWFRSGVGGCNPRALPPRPALLICCSLLRASHLHGKRRSENTEMEGEGDTSHQQEKPRSIYQREQQRTTPALAVWRRTRRPNTTRRRTPLPPTVLNRYALLARQSAL